MELLIVILLIWQIFIQVKLNKISDVLNSQNKKTSQVTNVLNDKNVEEVDVCEEKSLSVLQDELEMKISNLKNKENIVNNEVKIEETSTKTLDFETMFLGNIFHKIGALALIISVGIFLKLISPYIIFTPAMKISLGYIVSILILLFGYCLKEEKMQPYKETLIGTGVSIGFITTYCASALFNLFTPITTSIIATAILFAVYFIANKQKTVSLITIALVAGYLNPFFIMKDVSWDFLFAYYIFINLLSIIYVYKNPDKSLINFINLVFTFLTLSLFIPNNNNPVHVIYPLTLWFIYLLFDIVRKEKSLEVFYKTNVLNWLNFGVLTLFSIILFEEKTTYIGYLISIVSIFYFAITVFYIKNKSEEFKPYLYSFLCSIFLVIFFLTDGVLRVSLWSVVSIILSFLVCRYKLNYLVNWSLSYALTAITSLFFVENVIHFNNIKTYVPILNIRTLAFLFPLVSTGLSGLMILKSDDTKLKNTGMLFKFSFISLLYLYITFEINDFISSLNIKNINEDFILSMIFTIIGFKYALQIKNIYNKTNYILFNYVAYTVLVISALKLLFSGFEYIPSYSFVPIANIRFVAFVFAIATFTIFAKWTKLSFFKYIALIWGFILVHVETANFVLLHSNIGYLTTVMWLLYAGIVTLIGVFKNLKCLKNTGIWVSILAICRIFFYDLGDTDIIYKLVAFLSLGLVLLIISYFYNKKK